MLDRLAPPAAGPIAAFDAHGTGASAGSTIAELSKASPPLAVGVAGISGMPLEAWVFILTLIYLGLQIGYLCYKWMRDLRRDAKEDRADG